MPRVPRSDAGEIGRAILGAMVTARIRVLLPATVAAGALVLGCGGSGEGGGASARTTPAPAASETATAAPRRAARARTGVRLQRIGSFQAPVYVTAPPEDSRVQFVVEQAGRIMVVRDGRKLARPFLDITSKVRSGGEQGLLSMAFAPDYRRSGRFYVYYTDLNGDTRVIEYRRASADRASEASARQVLFQEQPEPNHNGGLLLFGPDRLLYIGLGDGGGGGDRHGPRGNAQNLGTLLGKILRIDPRRSGGRPYSVPASNPFVGRRGARGEIYAYGLRNPWRFSFDRRTGDLSIGDVGQNAVEEVSFVRSGRGRNFGWRPFEGRRRYTPGESAPGHVRPVIERFHSRGNCSITGGVVVRDPGLPALNGRYVFGDVCRGRIESARLSPGRARAQRTTRLRVPALVSFGEDARGRVYAVSLNGPVYRLVPRR
jgi:glucose/arabinose dehydrogenase